MIMFMKIITGLGSRRVPSSENSGELNFKLYCYPGKELEGLVAMFKKYLYNYKGVSVSLLLTVKADVLFFSLCFFSSDLLYLTV